MQHQRRIRATGAVVLIMGASLFLWAVFRPHADLQRIYGILLGLLGQVAGMALLLLAERIHLLWPRIVPGKTAAVMGALALLLGIGVAILVVRDPAPPHEVARQYSARQYRPAQNLSAARPSCGWVYACIHACGHPTARFSS